MSKYKFVECKIDIEGNLRIDKFISKKEHERTRKICNVYMLRSEDWRGRFLNNPRKGKK